MGMLLAGARAEERSTASSFAWDRQHDMNPKQTKKELKPGKRFAGALQVRLAVLGGVHIQLNVSLKQFVWQQLAPRIVQ